MFDNSICLLSATVNSSTSVVPTIINDVHVIISQECEIAMSIITVMISFSLVITY